MSDDYFVGRVNEHLRTLNETSTKTASQLSTWLVLGNAGGIVLLLNWRQGGDLPATVDARGVYIALATGLLLSVLGMIVQYFGAGIAAILLDKQNRGQVLFLQRRAMSEELEATGALRPDEWKEMDTKHTELTNKVLKSLPLWLGLAGLQIVFQITSGICLAIAVLTPIAAEVFG